jgi:hypothetical protein
MRVNPERRSFIIFDYVASAIFFPQKKALTPERSEFPAENELWHRYSPKKGLFSSSVSSSGRPALSFLILKSRQ